jgi:hypothetical protein
MRCRMSQAGLTCDVGQHEELVQVVSAPLQQPVNLIQHQHKHAPACRRGTACRDHDMPMAPPSALARAHTHPAPGKRAHQQLTQLGQPAPRPHLVHLVSVWQAHGQSMETPEADRAKKCAFL